MLFFSGLGSLASARFVADCRRVMPRIFLGIAALVALGALLFDPVLGAIGQWPYPLRIATCILLIAPAAFLMGFPFPTGMTMLSRLGKEAVLPVGVGHQRHLLRGRCGRGADRQRAVRPADPAARLRRPLSARPAGLLQPAGNRRRKGPQRCSREGQKRALSGMVDGPAETGRLRPPPPGSAASRLRLPPVSSAAISRLSPLRFPLPNGRRSYPPPPGCPAKGREPESVLTIISFYNIIFLDTARCTPYIGPVNAQSAPAAASRRPHKKRTKKQAGTFPFSGRRRRSAILSAIQCAILCAALCAGGA